MSLDIHAGQVLGLVGENGAGKSTLIRVLGGIEQPVRGSVTLKGVPQRFRSSADSQAAGISVVSQEFRQVPQLSVADNIFLGHELRPAAWCSAAGPAPAPPSSSSSSAWTWRPTVP